jgi:hypothetical protein
LNAGEFEAVLSEMVVAVQSLAPRGFADAFQSVFGYFCRNWQK